MDGTFIGNLASFLSSPSPLCFCHLHIEKRYTTPNLTDAFSNSVKMLIRPTLYHHHTKAKDMKTMGKDLALKCKSQSFHSLIQIFVVYKEVAACLRAQIMNLSNSYNNDTLIMALKGTLGTYYTAPTRCRIVLMTDLHCLLPCAWFDNLLSNTMTNWIWIND